MPSASVSNACTKIIDGIGLGFLGNAYRPIIHVLSTHMFSSGFLLPNPMKLGLIVNQYYIDQGTSRIANLSMIILSSPGYLTPTN